MIEIGKIAVVNKEGRSRLAAEVHVPQDAIRLWRQRSAQNDAHMADRYRTEYLDENSCFSLWFEVEEAYAASLCAERSDAFVAAALYFAMLTGEDIRCEAPVTDRLLCQIREQLIPSLCRESEGYRRIAIFAEPAPETERIHAFTGTGVSCGVDSFSTILLQMREELPEAERLTHLTLFNTGSMNFSGYAKDKPLAQWRSETEKEFEERIALGKQAAQELRLQFFAVDTNIPDLYQGQFLYSHTYRNLSAVLATQKMWRNYYYASAGNGERNPSDLHAASGSSDRLILPALSAPSLCFHSGGAPYTRLEKIGIIADNPVVQKYLNVCSFRTVNCGRCEKCTRTLAALDLLGKREAFQTAFPDMTYYERSKWKLMVDIAEAQEDDFFKYEMKQYMKQHGVKLSAKSKLYHALLPLRKVRRRLRRTR